MAALHTVPPFTWDVWREWSPRALADHVLPRARQRDKYDKYALFGLRKDKDNRHYIRLNPLDKAMLLSRQYASSPPIRYNFDPWMASWPDIKAMQSYRPYEPVSIVLPAPAPARPGGPAAHGWSTAARGWAAGAVVLALLVLIVRAAENCLHKKLFRAIYMHTNVGAGEIERDRMRGHYHLHGVRRQGSDEWSTPNVTATSLQPHSTNVGSLPRLDDSDASLEPFNSDLPPPYSECAGSSTNINKYISEEPPPPYSACYVSYTNPKDGIPAVYIHNRLRQNILDERAHTSSEIDNVQNNLIENGLRIDTFTSNTCSNDSENNDSGTGTELVFDNGRIVERTSLDFNSNSDGIDASNDTVENRIADIKDRVVYIDETASENTTPERVLLV